MHLCFYVNSFNQVEGSFRLKASKTDISDQSLSEDVQRVSVPRRIFWTSVSSHISTWGFWGFWDGSYFPRGHGTSRLSKVVTDGDVGKCQMANQHVSLSPLLSQKSLARVSPCSQQRLRCLAVCLLSGVLFDIAAFAPCPGDYEKSQATETLGGAPLRDSGSESCLHLHSTSCDTSDNPNTQTV